MPPTPKDSQMICKRFAIKASDATLKENSLSGAAAVMGNIDAHGDVIFPGAFSSALPEFLRSGFVAVGHDWDDLPIAYPTLAEERGRQLYTEATFHSTQDAQDARTIASERIAAGKSVGLSVGFFVAEDGSQWFETGIKLLEFAKNNGYDLSMFDTAAIGAADDYIRAITKVGRLVEYSIVSIPANSEAEAMSAKAEGRTESTQPLRTPRELEKFLRDAGMSSTLAKASISNLRAHLRDAGPTEEVTKPEPEAERSEPPAEATTTPTTQEHEYLSLAARSLALAGEPRD